MVACQLAIGDQMASTNLRGSASPTTVKQLRPDQPIKSKSLGGVEVGHPRQVGTTRRFLVRRAVASAHSWVR